MIRVTVAYATPQRQEEIPIEVADNSTVLSAIQKSGILQLFSLIDLEVLKIGIFGQLVTPETCVREGDRIEIYRPLKRDPQTTRRMKAQQFI